MALAKAKKEQQKQEVPVVGFTLTFLQRDHKRIGDHARLKLKSKSDIMREAISEYLDSHEEDLAVDQACS